jgi:hypothetical protein
VAGREAYPKGAKPATITPNILLTPAAGGESPLCRIRQSGLGITTFSL